MIIYKITNKLDNKVYIGQTKARLSKRFLGHCHNTTAFSHISSAIHKYGRDNFTIEEIDRAETQEELDVKEINWITHYNSMDREIGYNILPGGGGRVHSEESRKRMSESQKKRPPRSKESIEKTRQANIGAKRKEGTGAKISAANKGRKGHAWTEEEKKEIGERNKGRKHSAETIEKMKLAQQKNTDKKKAYIFTEEHKQKLREARAKRVFTEEDKRKISEGLRRKNLDN